MTYMSLDIHIFRDHAQKSKQELK